MPLAENKTTPITLIWSVRNGFSTTEACVFGISALCLCIFTVVSNAVVIHLTRTSSELRPLGPLRSLLGSMAWGDLFMGLIVGPLAGQYSILEEWIFGEAGCTVSIFADG